MNRDVSGAAARDLHAASLDKRGSERLTGTHRALHVSRASFYRKGGDTEAVRENWDVPSMWDSEESPETILNHFPYWHH